MSVIRVIFELLVLYLLYKLIFEFIIPVFQTTKQVSKKMSEMQSQMNQQMKDGQPSSFTEKDAAPKPSKEDYIDFEEVK